MNNLNQIIMTIMLLIATAVALPANANLAKGNHTQISAMWGE